MTSNSPKYRDEFTIIDSKKFSLYLEIKLYDIKFKFTKGDKATNWPDEFEIISYESNILFIDGDGFLTEIKDETKKKGLLAVFAPEAKILKQMIPKWIAEKEAG